MQGLVLKSTGKWYQVLLEDQQIVQASIRGKLRLEGLKTTNPIAAGDRVIIEAGSDESWAILSVEPRHNYIVRKATNLSNNSKTVTGTAFTIDTSAPSAPPWASMLKYHK